MSDYECKLHPGNHQCGGCIGCTFAEYQKYRDLYEEALEALRMTQRARSLTGQANTMVNRLLNENALIREVN